MFLGIGEREKKKKVSYSELMDSGEIDIVIMLYEFWDREVLTCCYGSRI